MTNGKTIAIITHFYKKRIPNLQPIVDSLQGQVDEVVIWNNDEPFGKVRGARIAQSKFNHGCQARFFAALEEPHAEFFLFHDNDIITKPGSVQRLRDKEAEHPGNIAAGTGERRIYNGELLFLSRAQFELIQGDTLRMILTDWPKNHRSMHDDLWLSSRMYRMGRACYKVPISWKNIHDDTGFWRDPKWGGPKGFENERQRVFTALMNGEL